MINLPESNLNYRNLKQEISEIFPELSKYVLASIYSETLRGQIREREDKKKTVKTGIKRKRVSDKVSKVMKHYKSYIIKLPNLLENICSDQLCPENMSTNTEQVNKAMGVLLKKQAENLQTDHSLVFLVLWDSVGRFRTMKKELLIEELERYADIKLPDLEEILKDLVLGGFIIQIGNEYGISGQLKL